MTVSFLEFEGGRLAYDLTGPADGPLVIGVPGMGDRRGTYRFLAPRLADAGFRVACLDVRGHGDSSVGWPDHSQESVGRDVVALTRHLGGPATLIGNSSGAGAVAFAAANAPQDVAGLVMIATFTQEPQLNLLMRAAQGAVLRSPALWGMYYASLYPTRKPDDLTAYLRAMKKTLREPGRMAAVRGLIAPGNRSWVELADRITCPTLIVHGTKDPDFPDPRAAAELARDKLTGTGAEILMIDDAGHYPHAEMPEPTTDGIRAFLRAARA